VSEILVRYALNTGSAGFRRPIRLRINYEKSRKSTYCDEGSSKKEGHAKSGRGVGSDVNHHPHGCRRERAGQRRNGGINPKDGTTLPGRSDLGDETWSKHEDHVAEGKGEDRA
jgi:hypothetical protein